jgi:hypothetical protein
VAKAVTLLYHPSKHPGILKSIMGNSRPSPCTNLVSGIGPSSLRPMDEYSESNADIGRCCVDQTFVLTVQLHTALDSETRVGVGDGIDAEPMLAN